MEISKIGVCLISRGVLNQSFFNYFLRVEYGDWQKIIRV